MIVKQLNLNGFKAHDRTIKLDKLNIIFGVNKTGKTAILQAITFAITGYTKLGSTLEATQQLVKRGGCMVETIIWQDDENSYIPGLEFDRAISKDVVTGSMKMHLSIKGREQLKLKKAEEWLSEHIGNFAPTFDINAFLGLSADKRRDFVLQLCNAGEKTDPGALYHKFFLEYCAISLGRATLGAHSNNYDKSLPDATCLQKRQYLLDKLSETEATAIDDLLGIIKPFIKGDISNAITAALDAAKTQTNGAKMAKDANDQAVRSFSERKDAIKIVSESADQLKDRKKELTERKEDRIANLNERKGMQTAIDDRKNQIAWHETILENIKLNLCNLAPMDIDDLKQKIEHNNVEIETLEGKLDDEVVDTAQIKHEALVAENKHRDLQRSTEHLEHSYNNALADSDRLAADLERANSDDWTKVIEILNAIGTTLSTDTVNGKAWGELCDILHNHDTHTLIKSLEAEIEAVNANIRKLDDDHIDALRKTGEAKEVWLKLLEEFNKAEQEASDKLDQQQQYRDEISSLETANGIQATAIKTRETYLAQQQKDNDSAHKEITVHKKRLEELLQKCDAFNVGELEKEIEGLKGSMAEIDTKLEDIGKFDQLTQSYHECIKKAKEENIKHEVGKKLCAGIRAVREDIMDSLTLPLMDRMYEFLSIAAPGHKPFIDLENDQRKSIFRLGWTVNDERRVALPAMSGGESVTFCAALAYAMVDLADTPLKLLMLEIGDCDIDFMDRLLTAIGECSTHSGMQAIIATHAPLTDAIRGEWNVIDLNQMVLDEQKPAQATP